MRVIADAGFFVGFLDKDDQYYPWAITVARKFRPPFYTCEAVITEAAYLLAGKTGQKGMSELLQLVKDKLVIVDFNIEDHIERVQHLIEKYETLPMDFADACLVVMTEQPEYKECVVLTVDRTDFSIYRRNGKSEIPIIAP